jgi:hypothetical protein
MTDVRAGDIRMYYEDQGDPAAEPLLLPVAGLHIEFAGDVNRELLEFFSAIPEHAAGTRR